MQEIICDVPNTESRGKNLKYFKTLVGHRLMYSSPLTCKVVYGRHTVIADDKASNVIWV